jgi:hypothetical protein
MKSSNLMLRSLALLGICGCGLPLRSRPQNASTCLLLARRYREAMKSSKRMKDLWNRYRTEAGIIDGKLKARNQSRNGTLISQIGFSKTLHEFLFFGSDHEDAGQDRECGQEVTDS